MKKYVALSIIFMILIGITVYKLYGRQEEGITATGTIEVTRVDITSKVNGYIGMMRYETGDSVGADEVMAQVTRPDLNAQLLRDEAALDKAKVQLSDVQQGARSQEREEARASLDSAKSVYQQAKLDYERYRSLFEQGAISRQQVDTAKSAFEVAMSSVNAAQQRLSLIQEGTRAEQIIAQQKEVERNQAIVQASRVMLDDTVLRSPLAGLVLSKNYERGEYAPAGAALYTVANLDDCWVKIYIASTQLGLINVGQQAEVRIDSFPERVFQGTIKEISDVAEFTPRQSVTQRERANLVFAVKVKLDNPDHILKPGMPADVVLK